MRTTPVLRFSSSLFTRFPLVYSTLLAFVTFMVAGNLQHNLCVSKKTKKSTTLVATKEKYYFLFVLRQKAIKIEFEGDFRAVKQFSRGRK